MTDDLATRKAGLRQRMKSLRAALGPDERAAAAASFASHARRLLALRPPGIVSGYIPIRGEADPRPLMAALAAAGWRLALPRVEGAEISFRAHADGAALACGGFGLTEPQADAQRVAPDLLLVPLLAFDRRGNRLGYGRGYYDRALARLPGALAVGLAYGVQECADVPCGAHDTPLAAVATEREWIDCRR